MFFQDFDILLSFSCSRYLFFLPDFLLLFYFSQFFRFFFSDHLSIFYTLNMQNVRML